MPYNPNIHHRRSIRLKTYDYSQEGAYFITICAHNRLSLFSEVIDGKICLTASGCIVQETWEHLPNYHSRIILDESIIMPNHVHGIIMLNDVGAGFPRPDSLGAETAPLHKTSLNKIVAYLKYKTTKEINSTCNTPGTKIWQRNYYERVIHSDDELHRTRQYIIDDPLNWTTDPENPLKDIL